MKYYKRIDLDEILLLASVKEPKNKHNLVELTEEEYNALLDEIENKASEMEVE